MFNVIKDNEGSRNKYKRLGRGIGSGKGKTSARGGKGQTARSGVAINGFEGGQMPLVRRLPKRGFASRRPDNTEVINFSDVAYFIENGKLNPKSITIADLRNCGLLQGITSRIKLLGDGELKSAITIEVHQISKKAQEALSKSGSKVTLVDFRRAAKSDSAQVAKKQPATKEVSSEKEVAPAKKVVKKAVSTTKSDEKKVAVKKTVSKVKKTKE